MTSKITRRDFINSTLVGSGAALCGQLSACNRTGPQAEQLPEPDMDANWYGYGGVGQYAESHGNTPELVFRAHSVRDGTLDASMPAIDTGETYDLIVVGGGMAGLGAARRFKQKKKPGERMLLLDNHPVLGGESKRNEFMVDGHRLIAPQGANSFGMSVAGQVSGDQARYFDELNIPRQYRYPQWPADREPRKFAQDDYQYLLGQEDTVSSGYFVDQSSHGVPPHWVKDPWDNGLRDLPVSDKVRAELVRWRKWNERPADAPPNGSDELLRWLDSMTYEDYLLKVLKLGQETVEYANPVLAIMAGGGADMQSAYAAMGNAMPGFSALRTAPPRRNRHSFPGGNDGFARIFLKDLAPYAIEGGTSLEDIIGGKIRFDLFDAPANETRIRLRAMVIGVVHDGAPETAQWVTVTYTKGRRIYRAKARRVVMATGGWITKHVVKDIPAAHKAAYDSFVHTPILVANVALTNWRAIYKSGVTAFRWWGDLGFSACLRRPMHVGDYQPPFDPDKPVVISFYIPFIYPGNSARDQGAMGRAELLSTSFPAFEEKLRGLMTRLFGQQGFDHKKDIAGIILNRWGHAYITPTPGFFYGSNGQPAASDVIRQRHGRIAFGHSELLGHQYWNGAADEGSRAVDQLITIA